MNDPSQNHINQEELDYLYSLYKSNQSGSSAQMSKEDLKKLIESEHLSSSQQKGELSLDIPELPPVSQIYSFLKTKLEK